MISINRTGAKQIILACARAGRTAHMIGPPGNGKTSLAIECADALKLPYVPFRTSTKLPEDAGGYMSPDNAAGVVHAMPLDSLARICKEPCFFFIDEMINGTLAVRAGLLQILDERRIGDMKLHPGTVVCLASNPEAQSTGGIAESLPERNRCVRFMLDATLPEYQVWLRKEALNTTAHNETWCDLASAFAAMLDYSPDLLMLNPPAGIEAGTEGWASSRAWHIAIDVCSDLIAQGITLDSDVGRCVLAGTLGTHTADAFVATYGLRKDLPSMPEIIANPKGAKLPQTLPASIASLGVIAEVGRRNPGAAWIYASRLTDEVRLAAAMVCQQYPLGAGGTADASAARNVLAGKLNMANAGK